MISLKTAENQLQRLVNTPFFPSKKRDQQELLKALLTSRTEKIMVASVDDLVESCDRQVTVALVRSVVSRKNAEDIQESQHLVNTCQICGGTGVRVTKGRQRFGWNPDGTPRYMEAEGVEDCLCRAQK